MKKILPIGSVVLLKDAEKRIMIIGYYPTTIVDNKEVTYDYSGCLFPEGVIDSDKSMLFNQDDIDHLFFYGLMDEEQEEFAKALEEAVKEEMNSVVVNPLPELVTETVPSATEVISEQSSGIIEPTPEIIG